MKFLIAAIALSVAGFLCLLVIKPGDSERSASNEDSCGAGPDRRLPEGRTLESANFDITDREVDRALSELRQMVREDEISRSTLLGDWEDGGRRRIKLLIRNRGSLVSSPEAIMAELLEDLPAGGQASFRLRAEEFMRSLAPPAEEAAYSLVGIEMVNGPENNRDGDEPEVGFMIMGFDDLDDLRWAGEQNIYVSRPKYTESEVLRRAGSGKPKSEDDWRFRHIVRELGSLPKLDRGAQPFSRPDR